MSKDVTGVGVVVRIVMFLYDTTVDRNVLLVVAGESLDVRVGRRWGNLVYGVFSTDVSDGG